MSPPRKRTTAPGEEAVAAQRKGKHHQPGNGDAADPRQTEEFDGSFSEGDPERPGWDNTTVLEAEYDYYREDRSYSHTVLKGRRADGVKCFLNGRRFDGSISDLQMARQDGRKFYTFPGLTLFEKGAGE